MPSALSVMPGPAVLSPDLLRAAPAARRVLDRYGLRGCGGQDGPRESLGFFAQTHDVPLERIGTGDADESAK